MNGHNWTAPEGGAQDAAQKNPDVSRQGRLTACAKWPLTVLMLGDSIGHGVYKGMGAVAGWDARQVYPASFVQIAVRGFEV
jgi:hypothetical protein